MEKFEIVRAYEHKTFGPVGEVTFAGTIDDVTINGQTVAPDGVRHLLTFALQTLQDAYAGSATADEAVASWEKKLGKIIAGEIGTRTGGRKGASDVEVEMAKIAIAAFKMTFEKGTVTADRYAAALEEIETRTEEEQGAIRKLAEKRVADAAKEREEIAALGLKIDV